MRLRVVSLWQAGYQFAPGSRAEILANKAGTARALLDLDSVRDDLASAMTDNLCGFAGRVLDCCHGHGQLPTQATGLEHRLGGRPLLNGSPMPTDQPLVPLARRRTGV